MQAAWPQHQFAFGEIDMMLVGKARNELVRLARQGKADVAWYIDDDVLIPPNAGELVDQAIQLGVVSGLYFSRRFPYFPQAYAKATGPEYESNPHQLYWPHNDYAEGLSQVDAVGGGCMAIRLDVFQTLEDHFNERAAHRQKVTDQLDADAGHPDHVYQAAAYLRQYPSLSPWFEFLDGKGEDLYFCERLAEIGQPVWLNSNVKCRHLGEVPIEEVHFQQLKPQMHRLPITAAGDAVPPPVLVDAQRVE